MIRAATSGEPRAARGRAACARAMRVFLNARFAVERLESAACGASSPVFGALSTHTIQARHFLEIHDTALKDFSHPCHEARDFPCGLVISY
jgi:hypothetical protein